MNKLYHVVNLFIYMMPHHIISKRNPTPACNLDMTQNDILSILQSNQPEHISGNR